MLTRSGDKWVLTIQKAQLWDAALVWLGFWLAAILRDPVRDLLGMLPMAGRSLLADMSWVLYIAVPFTPLALGYFGFYENAHQRPRSRALLQVVKALAVLCLVLALISFLTRLQDASRLIMGLALPIVAFLLLMRDWMTCWRAQRD